MSWSGYIESPVSDTAFRQLCYFRLHQASTPSCQPFFPVQLHSLLIFAPVLFHDDPDELPKHEEKYELHRLIAALLSNQLNEQQRLAILESEYNIPINTDFRKDVNVMCNLGQGIEDRAIAETTAKIILNMYHSGYSLAQIADAVEMTETEVLDIITSASA